LNKLHTSLSDKVKNWQKIVKIGRTHLQDATPITLGQEFSGYAAQIQYSLERIEQSLTRVYYLAQGGTAVGTGINCPEGFAENLLMKWLDIHLINSKHLPTNLNP
jgi:fumarate hydratase class II